MKFLLEFAKFRDIAIARDPQFLGFINKNFEEDEVLIDKITLDIGKDIDIIWNNKAYHSIIERIKNRTTFKSISEFNEVVAYGLNYILPNELNKSIKSSGRYALHFNNNNFYLVISLNYERLFDDDAEIFILTLTTSTIEEDVVEIYDD